MLPKEMENRILILAAVGGKGRVSIQNLKLLALKYRLQEAEFHAARAFCARNHIAVFDEAAEEQAARPPKKPASPAPEETRGRQNREEIIGYIRSLPYAEAHPDLAGELEDAAARLTLGEAKTLAYRYGLTDGVCHTTEEAGAKFGVPRKRVRMAESMVFRKRPPLRRTKHLTDFLNG